MAKYRVVEKSYVNGSMVEEGQVIEYDGEVSSNLVPVKKGAKADDQSAGDEPEVAAQ